MSSNRQQRLASEFKASQGKDGSKYTVASETINTDDKLAILESMGRPELIDLFKEWKPRVSTRKSRGAPLDQRVSITVTGQERVSLDNELRAIKSSGDRITMSQFIRNRALGSVDINGWREVAESALSEIEETVKNQVSLRKERDFLAVQIDEEDDADESALYSAKLHDINRRLTKIVAQNEKRNNRLSGRMSMPEAETVKWRAQRLCVSSSDYLRMMIFGLEPNSAADSHMSLDAKRRFHISSVDVANNGWGNPPTIYECSQCENYMEEIQRLRSENEQLRTFS